MSAIKDKMITRSRPAGNGSPKAKLSMVDNAFMRKIFLFRDLSEDEMEEVLRRTQTRNFPANVVIIEEGETGVSMFITLSGEVKITKRLIQGLSKDTPKEWMSPPQAPPAPQPLTVSQLLAGKDQYLGNRVTVKGPAGPVLIHHKSMLLRAPEGMVEVRFGKLPDQKLVQQLTFTPLEKPVTVTRVLSLPPKGGTAKLQIDGEAVDF